ncbi:hypothetical protein ABTJ92_20175, partial [Acinetobacter baumannii]
GRLVRREAEKAAIDVVEQFNYERAQILCLKEIKNHLQRTILQNGSFMCRKKSRFAFCFYHQVSSSSFL